ncbi:MAG: 50S ribosomal protein L9 [Deltaproteobacteria bacterium]|nr:50S ribosomal protein L9 [Deltaproteobacteria bacterium]
MQLILREDVKSLGQSGDVVTVKDGYGRNYLIPRGLAVPASARQVARLEHDKRVISQREQKLLRSAEAVRDRLEQLSINISKRVGEEQRLFGSVTAREIVDALAAQGVTIDRKAIQLDEPIRALGTHDVPVRLRRDVTATLKVSVVAAE